MPNSCPHLGQIDTQARPSADGCQDCLRTGGWWVHLRMCRMCGHVGCCDSSPSRHASAHNATVGYPLVSSRTGGSATRTSSRSPSRTRPRTPIHDDQTMRCRRQSGRVESADPTSKHRSSEFST
ncbi:MAG TPA: UBP-type zinc finger domain-containing protein [Jiangellaceae bacterium]|nr:UBP-type zinc finger domain-containing protein [Jiangellaceae bacterium]